MDSLPLTVEGLIQALDASYPDKCPEPSMSERDIWIAVGQRSVVNKLLSLLKEEQETILTR